MALRSPDDPNDWYLDAPSGLMYVNYRQKSPRTGRMKVTKWKLFDRFADLRFDRHPHGLNTRIVRR
jgi:hypothetical protein